MGALVVLRWEMRRGCITPRCRECVCVRCAFCVVHADVWGVHRDTWGAVAGAELPWAHLHPRRRAIVAIVFVAVVDIHS